MNPKLCSSLMWRIHLTTNVTCLLLNQLEMDNPLNLWVRRSIHYNVDATHSVVAMDSCNTRPRFYFSDLRLNSSAHLLSLSSSCDRTDSEHIPRAQTTSCFKLLPQRPCLAQLTHQHYSYQFGSSYLCQDPLRGH